MRKLLGTIYKTEKKSISSLKIKKVEEKFLKNEIFASYEIECDYGFGHTIGVALRRTILNFTEGVAPVAIKVNEANHLFDSVSGTKSSVLDIVLQLQKIPFRFIENDMNYCFLSLKKKGSSAGDKVYSGDFEKSKEVNIINGNIEICSLDNSGLLDLNIILANGNGYTPFNEHVFQPNLPEGFFAVDSLFTSGVSCGYSVEKVTSGKRDYDTVHLNISTNGSVTPDEILNEAGKKIVKVFEVFSLDDSDKEEENIPEEKEDEREGLLQMKLEDVNLSIRAKNCLLANKIFFLGDLLDQTETELQSLSGLGSKSLTEIKSFLMLNGLQLGKNSKRLI